MTLLPTEKTKPAAGLGNRNLLIYGNPKSGKSTLAAGLRPETTLFLACEDGLSAIEAFQVPIRAWQDFLDVANELATTEHGYDTVVIDTADELARMCADFVTRGLADSEGIAASKFVHASDFEYGKGWDAVASQFRLKVSAFCNLGFAVIFVSHAKDEKVKNRVGVEVVKLSPDVGQKGMRKWLLGFVDLIAFSYVEEAKDGVRHVLRFRGDADVASGGRVAQEDWAKLPDTVEMDPAAVNAVFEAVWG